jgi:tetratricopeptide (TPR) repeat protein
LDANSDNAGLSLKEQFEQGAIDPGQLSMIIASLQDASFQLPPTADLADITESLSLHRKVVKNTPNNHPELPGYLSNFGNTLQCRFEHTGNENDLSMAIYSFQCAVELTPEGDTVLPARWIALGSLLKQRFELDGKEEDLSKAVSAHRSAVKSSQMDDSVVDYIETLNSLGSILLFSFDHTKDLDDVSEAVTTFREIVGRTSDKGSDLPRYLNNLGEALRRRFRQCQAEEDLSEAISSLEKALEISSDADELRPAFLTNLGLAFWAHFSLENDTKKSQVPELHDLGSVYQVQSRVKSSAQPPETDNPSLNKAINLHRMAVQLSPDQHPALHDFLNNLTVALHSRFKLYGASEDLSEALSAILRAIDIIPKGDKFLPVLQYCRCSKMGTVLRET